MRIAHVITRLILGGAQENTVLSCHDMIHEHGDEVLLITGPALGPEGSLLESARERGIPLVVIDELRRPIHPWRDWQSYRKIKAALREFRPEVVHTHSAKAGLLGRRAAWSLDVPAIIHTVHGAPFHPYQSRGARWFFRLCERYAAGRCHALVSVADAMTDRLVDAGVADLRKFTTIYSGMDLEPFLRAEESREQTRQELGYSGDQIVVGNISRFVPLKGHEYLIAAARDVVAKLPRVQFLLVGDGILRTAVEEQLEFAGLAQHFQITGMVPPQHVARLIGAMDLLIHTSLREGLARALPQAMIAGRPVVSFDIDGAREVVIDGETGILLPPQTTQPLADAICSLAVDREERLRLGQEGRRRFTDQFCHQHMSRQLKELYCRVLEGSKTSSP